MPMQARKTCAWTADRFTVMGESDLWESECGAAWCFTHDPREDKGLKFCMYCGRLLRWAWPDEEGDDE